MIDHKTLKRFVPTLFLGITIIFLAAAPGYAQFLNLELEIDAKLTAQTEQSLNFGTLQTNSGHQNISFGSTNMGIFSITALENQVLLITIDKPTHLNHSNPSIEDQIPLNIFTRYGYSAQDFQNSQQLIQSTQSLQVETNPEPGPWNSIYLFIYGSVDIGNISEGVYSNNIVLDVQYI